MSKKTQILCGVALITLGVVMISPGLVMLYGGVFGGSFSDGQVGSALVLATIGMLPLGVGASVIGEAK